MYIEKSDFIAYSPSTPTMTDAEFGELGERASDVIDIITFNRIILAGGLSTYEAATQAAVKKAVCAQVQYMQANGGIDTVIGMSGSDIQSCSVGKFSYTRRQSGQAVGGIPVSPLIQTYLLTTGLLYRGLSSC
jgi:hypothetical protein